MMEEERDFFVRELESMDWGGEEMAEEGDVGGNHAMNGTGWDGGLQVEGWA
jgi:hypothetical protein